MKPREGLVRASDDGPLIGLAIPLDLATQNHRGESHADIAVRVPFQARDAIFEDRGGFRGVRVLHAVHPVLEMSDVLTGF